MRNDQTITVPNDVVRLLDRLEAHGHTAWLVGGCVRDAWYGRVPKDYDIASDATPEEVEVVFPAETKVRIGRAFGTVGVHTGRRLVEITTFREESDYADGRHPSRVQYASDVLTDLARRDFTMNAMAWHPRRGWKDPFGGRRDLEAGVLRAVGSAEQRIAEDALRILRAVRFAHRFQLETDPALLRACREQARSLRRISRERITAEVEQMLVAAKPSDAMRRMEAAGVLPILFPFLDAMRDWDQGTPYHHLTLYEHTLCVLDGVEPDLSLRWAALLHDVGKLSTKSVGPDGVAHYYGHDRVSETVARAFLENWRLPKTRSDEICLLVRRHMANVNPYTKKSLKRLLRQMEVAQLEKLFNLQEADCICASNQGTTHIEEGRTLLRQILEENEPFQTRHLAINGTDLLDLGIPEGREIGAWLDWALQQVEEGTTPNEKKSLLSLIQAQRGRN